MPQAKRQPQKKPQPKRRLRARAQNRNAVAAPIGIGLIRSTNKPKLVNTQGGVRITHSEMITQVVPTIQQQFAANLQFSYRNAINPGNEQMFPWLASQAVAWQSYVINRLVFKYYSNASTSSPGAYYTCVDYDPTNPQPDSIQEMMKMRGAVRNNVWLESALVYHPADNVDKRRFVIEGGATVNPLTQQVELRVPAKSSVNDFYAGWLYCLFQGTSTDVVPSGDLWVEYDITFYTPQTERSVSSGQNVTSSLTASNIRFPRIDAAQSVVSDDIEERPAGLFAGSPPRSVIGDVSYTTLGRMSGTYPAVSGVPNSGASTLIMSDAGKYVVTITSTGSGNSYPPVTAYGLAPPDLAANLGLSANAAGFIARFLSVASGLFAGTPTTVVQLLLETKLPQMALRLIMDSLSASDFVYNAVKTLVSAIDDDLYDSLFPTAVPYLDPTLQEFDVSFQSSDLLLQALTPSSVTVECSGVAQNIPFGTAQIYSNPVGDWWPYQIDGTGVSNATPGIGRLVIWGFLTGTGISDFAINNAVSEFFTVNTAGTQAQYFGILEDPAANEAAAATATTLTDSTWFLALANQFGAYA